MHQLHGGLNQDIILRSICVIWCIVRLILHAMLNVSAIDTMLKENSAQDGVDYAPQLWALQNVLAYEQ